jgi:hypothetical protein
MMSAWHEIDDSGERSGVFAWSTAKNVSIEISGSTRAKEGLEREESMRSNMSGMDSATQTGNGIKHR